MKYFALFYLTAFVLNAQHFSSSNDSSLKLPDQLAGDILIGELNCVSCHQSESDRIKNKTAPVLNDVQNRLKRSFIIDFLLDPQKEKSGTTMPDVLHKLGAERKKHVATAIAAFLTSDKQEAQKAPAKSEIDKGKDLYYSIGCVACHPSMKDDKELNINSVPLGNLAKKYLRTGLTDFLFEPHKVRPSGRMPDMKLTQKEASSLASFLIQQKSEETSIISDKNLINEGKKYFDDFKCVNCHKLEGHQPDFKNLTGLEKLKHSECKGPRYNLSQSQKKFVETSLNDKKEISGELKIQKNMAEYRCYSCHLRDSIGGPGIKEKFFTTSEAELGETGRIPPPLDKVGAKLQRSWMRKVLFKGESLRHYMNTRMPQFGEENIGHLIELFDKVDKIPSTKMTMVESREEMKSHREAGWKLVGTEGLNCVSCHNYNNHPSLGLKAMDIVSTSKRLKPDWFYQYMINPAAHRPGIVMPSFWPGGKAVQQQILNGDTTEQLRAIWYYFTIGQTQRLPKGLKVDPVILKPDQKVSVYRGRSSVAGYRGIAIGFPQGLNMSFNAELMNFTSFWKGRFVDVNWRGQAPGNFNPAERATIFNSGIPFQTSFENGQWPQPPKIDGKDRTNPDPLFVQRHGFKFKGYFTKDNQVTFMYGYKDIYIEDSVNSQSEKEIVRSLEFNSPKAQKIYFKIAETSSLKEVSKKVFRIDNSLEIETSEGSALKNNMLLMEVEVPAGISRINLKYRSLK